MAEATQLSRDDMELAHDARGITIRYEWTGSSSTIVTFAGKGVPPWPVPQTEYHKALRRVNDRSGRCGVNIITVVDTERRFYLDGNSQIIVDEVDKLLRKMETQRTLTIGLSMGGFAAVAFARRLHRCTTAVGFGAHSSIHPDVVPFDGRSDDLRSRIRQWDVVDCLAELDDDICYLLFYGDADPIDRLHAARYESSRHANMYVETIAGCGHNVVDFWTRQGLIERRLTRLIDPAMASADCWRRFHLASSPCSVGPGAGVIVPEQPSLELAMRR